ncbi:PRC-barrel protein [Candidatus Koribacter versatilis Ellin345]|uniref:PRC-barrel protein n=1 Tax=Koribacter versatilis (strain Ellin345) TaxID=204669 RepID=Q1IHJ2_KORVE|nr:PRC-barrel domain-containing protein [Candidatus Koribacter versatilis]ABF43658.1 PRC-barrel protein [Candidatus Koribacter versatilis Ellin345]
MAHFGTLRDYEFAKDAGDIRGSELYGARDEKLGKIDDVIFDHSSGSLRYAVVDTGGWLSTKKFLVPANQIFSRPDHDDDFAVNLTKDQIERFPVYDEKHVDSDRDFRDYESRYRKEWTTDGDVMHKEGSTHILTPEPSEMPPATGNMEALEGYNFTPQRIADKFSDPTPDPNKTRMRPAGLAARAEDTARPGASAGLEKDISAETRAAARRNEIAAGTEHRDSIRGLYDKAPIAPDDPMMAEQDTLTNPDDIYMPVEQRHRRVQGFEELLRRNRVDITARCGSCGEKKDRAA